MRKHVNAMNYEPKKAREMDPVSETQPDMSMSIRTIIQRFANGMSVTANVKNPEYYTDSNGIDLRTLDYVELDELKRKVADVILAKKQMDEAQRQKEVEARFRKIFEEELEAKAKDSPDGIAT
jgi:hypothetical protein